MVPVVNALLSTQPALSLATSGTVILPSSFYLLQIVMVLLMMMVVMMGKPLLGSSMRNSGGDGDGKIMLGLGIHNSCEDEE